MRTLIIGGDIRYNYLCESLKDKGFEVDRCLSDGCFENIKTKIENADIVLLPLPVTRDGLRLNSPLSTDDISLAELFALCRKKKIIAGCVGQCVCNVDYDYSTDESFCSANAMLTAEGALAELITNSKKALYGSKVLILGYGRIAQALSRSCDALCAKITIAARSEKALYHADSAGYNTVNIHQTGTLEKYGFIVNTVPARVLCNSLIDTVDKQATLIELASAPGGFDIDYAKKCRITTVNAQSLPSRYSPQTAAMIIERAVTDMLLGS